MSNDTLCFNGLDGDNGGYALPPMSAEDLFHFIRGESPPENLEELKQRQQPTRGVEADPKRLDLTGWGVIFAHDADPGIKQALGELLNLRQRQAGFNFKVFEGSKGFRRPRDTKTDFLARHGVGPGPAQPEKVPYYLLIVGSPADIPWRFQTELDVQHAVGRIWFDTLQEYADYAQSVVGAEGESTGRPRRAAFFGTANPNDGATQRSVTELVEPMYAKFKEARGDWQFTALLHQQATKAGLASLFAGPQPPSLLFAGCHGMVFSPDSPRQRPHQGALVCQDWPGPEDWHEPIPEDFYFAGDDLPGAADLRGLIGFLFACYGAGTPLYDEFARQAFKKAEPIAPFPFLARLPVRMLGRPQGALAIVGHVERAWSYSFSWPGAGTQTEVFEIALKRLFDGYPLGYALERFNERYAELATVLSNEIESLDFGATPDPYRLAGLWTANNDAREYVIIGDPAVRLPAGQPAPAMRSGALRG